eukprot:c27166_g1_i1 orf=145-342(+)
MLTWPCSSTVDINAHNVFCFFILVLLYSRFQLIPVDLAASMYMDRRICTAYMSFISCSLFWIGEL